MIPFSKNTIAFSAAAITLMVLGSACSRRKESPANGPHDTPIIVQGGSLWIWSSVNFLVPSSAGNVSEFTYYLPQNNQYVENISVYSDQTLKTKTGSVPIAGGTAWTLCARPHDLKIWSPNAASGPYVINFASALQNNSLPIFWPMQFGSGSGTYGFGRRHVNPAPLTELDLATGSYQCPTGSLTSCFGAGAKPPCSIPCGSPPCFVALNY